MPTGDQSNEEEVGQTVENHQEPSNRITRSEDLRFDVSKHAHNYGKSKTEVLSSVLEGPAELLTSVSEGSAEEPGAHRGIEQKLAVESTNWSKAYKQRRLLGSGHSTLGIHPFAKDYARIIHSPAFRRLQGKSQLIPSGEGEFFRTRMSHSLEVAEIGVRIARWLVRKENNRPLNWKLNRNLITCACLLHDIGHPPFGHSGEHVLNERMKDHGGFEGNAQTLRLVTRLENRLGVGNSMQQAKEEPRGLNLTMGTLASILKYDRMIPANDQRSPEEREAS